MNQPITRVLFICTGNYYRSRFAEALFNHRAIAGGLGWRAFSRGLLTEVVAGCGPLSIHTAAELERRGIAQSCTGARPVQLAVEDLQAADRVVALKEAEHRPLMLRLFPDWADRIDYWHVHDIDDWDPARGLAEIESQVDALFAGFQSFAPTIGA